MLGELTDWRALGRMRRIDALGNVLRYTGGVSNEVGLARHGSGHDALCDLGDQQ